MKNLNTTTLKLFGAAALVAAALPASAELIVNGDFSGTQFANTSVTDETALTTLAPAGTGWVGFSASGTGAHWGDATDVARLTSDQGGTGDRGGLVYQTINDGGSSTGAFTLTFDIEVIGSTRTDLGVYLVGWNVGDAEPSSDPNSNKGGTGTGDTTFPGDSLIPGGSVPLITTTGVDSEGGFMVWDKGPQNSQAVTAGGGFDKITLDVDLGTGYDFIAIAFQGGTKSTENVQLDNVSLVAVPEPGSLALLGLGGLLIAARRRRG